MIESLDRDIESFKAMKKELLNHHAGKFVIIYNSKLQGSYDTFDAAAEEALRQFGKGPYLIRQVTNGDDETINISASVAYRIVNGSN